MPTETIRPTAHTIVDATVTDPTNTYNANTGNYGVLAESVTGGVARLLLKSLAADTSPSGRTSVTLNVRATFATSDSNNYFSVYVRKVNTDPWTNVWANAATTGWGLSTPTTRSADVTAVMGSEPSPNWEVMHQFFKGGGGGPPDPV